MGFLLRRSWNNRGGADPYPWEKPVNQASKWLVHLSGSQRIEGEGGSFAISNSESRKFVLSVFVGDGGVVELGGSSGANTVQVSRTGQTVSVTARPNSGSAASTSFTTEMPVDRWAHVYVKCEVRGTLNNNVKVTAFCDFVQSDEFITTTDVLGNSFPTNGKTLTCNALSGWCWFADANRGFFGWGASSTIPISDAKYREAVLSNATWDVANPGEDWERPVDVRYLRFWVYQGGGGSGGKGGDGKDGGDGGKGGKGGNNTDGGTGARGGAGGRGGSGSNGGAGGKGGNNGADGSPGGAGGGGNFGAAGVTPTPGNSTGGAGGNGGAGGAGGSGGSGGAGGPGKVIHGVSTQTEGNVSGGSKGSSGSNGYPGGFAGSTGTTGTAGTNGMNPTVGGIGGTGGDGTGGGGPGVNGGDGAHCTFFGITSADSSDFSTGSTKFGATTFTHGLGLSDTDGGVVFYYQW